MTTTSKASNGYTVKILAAVAATLIAGIIGFLAHQVIINTGRISVTENELANLRYRIEIFERDLRDHRAATEFVPSRR